MSMLRIACAALLLALSACTQGIRPPAAPPADATLTFVHLNDTYRIGAVEDGTHGGFGRGDNVRLATGREVVDRRLETGIIFVAGDRRVGIREARRRI